MRVIIRKALPGDALALVELLEVRYTAEHKALAERGDVTLRTWSPQKMMEGVETILRKGIAYVAEADGRIIGSIGGDGAYAGWFTDDVIFAEFWNFVEPEFRKSRIATTLMKTLKTKVKERGFRYRASVISGKDPDRLERFYLRHGFKKLGAVVEG